MATAKPKPNRGFAAILEEAPTARPENAQPARKAQALTFNIEAELKNDLDRAVWWSGKKSSQREIINKALRAWFTANPQLTKPTPDEQQEQ